MTIMTSPIKDSSMTALKAAIQTALSCRKKYVAQAVMAGQMLLEMRVKYSSGHGGQKYYDREPESTLAEWLKTESVSLCERTARRWMDTAERVMKVLLDKSASDFVQISITLDGREFLISEVLTAAEDGCSEAMRTFRGTFEAHLADKTLAEASEAVLEGEAEPHRISRASNGKLKGGYRSENRRTYAKFVGRHFLALTECIDKWEKLIDKNPSEHAHMVSIIRAVVLGGHCNMGEFHGHLTKYQEEEPRDCKGWPKSFSKLMREVLNERLHSIHKSET